MHYCRFHPALLSNQAYRLIENNTAVQKKVPKDPYHWMKIGGRIAGGMAAVLAVGFVLCAVNPVMAKNLPVFGGLFEMLQDNVSFFGRFLAMTGFTAQSTNPTASTAAIPPAILPPIFIQ